MMYVAPDHRYSRDNTWILPTSDSRARIGITPYDLERLEEVLFVETARVGTDLDRGDTFATLEGLTYISTSYTPTNGRVTAVNPRLADEPEIIAHDTYGDGWIIEITLADPRALNDLMTAEQYKDYIASTD